jgi:hypothetical protein
VLAPAAAERDGRPLIAGRRLGDGEARQPVTQPVPAVPQVTHDPDESGGQRVHVPGGEDLTDAAHEIRPAADGIADHGDQAAGHPLVDHKSPRLAPARQGEDVPAGIPARHLCLIDEAQAADGQAALVPAHVGPQRPIAE